MCGRNENVQKEKKEKGNASVTQVTLFMPKSIFEWKSTVIGRQEQQGIGTWLGIF
jgi:hypothetical protein